MRVVDFFIVWSKVLISVFLSKQFSLSSSNRCWMSCARHVTIEPTWNVQIPPPRCRIRSKNSEPCYPFFTWRYRGSKVRSAVQIDRFRRWRAVFQRIGLFQSWYNKNTLQFDAMTFFVISSATVPTIEFKLFLLGFTLRRKNPQFLIRAKVLC